MSNSYEMMYILRPDLSEDQVGESVGKYQNFLTEKPFQNMKVKKRFITRLLSWNTFLTLAKKNRFL